jgi:2-amino-4-hydroxy-6-hydroxymethyldihydropteridine diphosphokinase
MNKLVCLSLGSNVGDRIAHLRAGIAELGALGEVVRVSSFYETEPLEVTNQPWFLNCAVKLDTEKMPKQLLSALLQIERRHGRNRAKDNCKGPRTLDLDILLFGSAVIETQNLTVPHPAMHQRRFVLEPLAEIAPEARHPVFKRSVKELWHALPPGQTVKKLAPDALAKEE